MHERELDELVRAVSNATRRQILRLCADQFVAAGDVATAIALSPASVSEHLKVLRKTELVQLERRGTMWLYQTNTELVRSVIETLTDALPKQTNNRSKS